MRNHSVPQHRDKTSSDILSTQDMSKLWINLLIQAAFRNLHKPAFKARKSNDLSFKSLFKLQYKTFAKWKSYTWNDIVSWLLLHNYFAEAKGFLRTMITESPRRNILLIKRSRLTGCCFFFPFPDLGVSVHISLTFSKTMLQCRSNAFTRASSFLLLRQLMRIWVLFFTESVSTDSGPVWNSSFSSCSSSSAVSSLFGLLCRDIMKRYQCWYFKNCTKQKQKKMWFDMKFHT